MKQEIRNTVVAMRLRTSNLIYFLPSRCTSMLFNLRNIFKTYILSLLKLGTTNLFCPHAGQALPFVNRIIWIIMCSRFSLRFNSNRWKGSNPDGHRDVQIKLSLHILTSRCISGSDPQASGTQDRFRLATAGPLPIASMLFS